MRALDDVALRVGTALWLRPGAPEVVCAKQLRVGTLAGAVVPELNRLSKRGYAMTARVVGIAPGEYVVAVFGRLSSPLLRQMQKREASLLSDAAARFSPL